MPFSRTAFTGFPFDREERDNSFQHQLDDLAKRHPEFAEHLNPTGWSRPRRTSGSSQDGSSASQEFPRSRRYRESPFGSRTFDQFFTPFDREFDQDPVYYNSRDKQQNTPQQQQQNTTNVPQNNQENLQNQVPDNTQKPPPAPPVAPQDRSRRPQNNIQQSNTVDLGQKQEPVDDSRNQRSMSAPPENRSTAGKRFISSVHIPNLNPGPAGDMGGRMSQPEQQPTHQQQQPQQQHNPNKPTERIIPIHIEGRDEPVIPKNVNTSFRQPSPQREQIFGQRPDFYKQFFDSQQQQPQPNQDDAQKQREELLRQQQQYQKQQQEAFQQQQQQQQQEQANVAAEPPKPPKPTPLEQIQLIQKDVSALMIQVETFGGKLRDKQYIYLDEMLTVNLLKLDNIETEGKDVIRQARKEAVKCIEQCSRVLEAKAIQNAKATEAPNELAVETSENKADVPMEMDVIQPEKEATPPPPPKAEEMAPIALAEVDEVAKVDEKNDNGDAPSQTEAVVVVEEAKPEIDEAKEKKKSKKKVEKK